MVVLKTVPNKPWDGLSRNYVSFPGPERHPTCGLPSKKYLRSQITTLIFVVK